jgi:hypothetical protein
MSIAMLHRSLAFICTALCVGAAAVTQAAELKPFLTLQAASPHALISIAEKAGALFDPTDSAGMKAQLAPFKILPGVDAAGSIRIALFANEDSALGFDAVIFLPISNWNTFNIPDPQWGMMLIGLKTMFKQNGGKYTFAGPMGEIVGYQKSGYFVVATEGAADFSAAADPKKIFAEVEKFTLGAHFNLDNLSLETVESILGSLALPLAMSGIDMDNFDPDAILAGLEEIFNQTSLYTLGVVVDPKTLDLTISAQSTPKKDSEAAERCAKVKSVKTKLGAFLLEGPQTVFSWHVADYLTDSAIEQFNSTLELITAGFMEGLRESAEDDESVEKLVLAAEVVIEGIQEAMKFYAEERLIDAAFALDSDGTFITAIATSKTDAITALDGKVYGTLLEIFGGDEGKIKRDYETVAGYSLSCVPDLLADLPEEFGLPEEVQKIPLNVFWGVKKGEAVVYAVGLDFAKTEKTLKTALGKTATPTPPKQMAVFALKPLGELLQKQILPLLEKLGANESELAAGKKTATTLAAADAGAKITIMEEFPGDACLYKTQIDGKFVTTFYQAVMQPAIEAAQGSAKDSGMCKTARVIRLQ